MPRKKAKAKQEIRRTFMPEFKQEAVQMVLDGHSPSSVAERLGYAEAASFIRAFKRWTGKTPAQFRRAEQG